MISCKFIHVVFKLRVCKNKYRENYSLQTVPMNSKHRMEKELYKLRKVASTGSYEGKF